MNILVVPSWYPSKLNSISGSFFKEQAEALAKDGMNVTVFALNPIDIKNVIQHPIKSELFKIKKHIANGVHTFTINIPTFGLNRINLFDYLYIFLFRLYYKVVEKEIGKVDIVHAHSYKFAGYAICKLFPNHPRVVTEHTSNIIINNLSRKDIKLLKYVLNNVKSFISVSNSLKNSIIKLTNTDKNILVIPNIVNDMFCYKEINNVNNCFEFISVSNLVPGKRADVLIRAFSLAFSNVENIVLKIAGEGPERKKLEDLIKQLSLKGRVKLLGQLPRDRIFDLYKNANAFAMASSFETFGVVYAESLMCGLPTIGTKNGGAEDILDCYGGFLCEVDDVKDIAEKLQFVVANYLSFDRKKIYNYASNRFSSTVIVDKLEEIYLHNKTNVR